MKIQSIEITNYKAFLGTHILSVGSNNVFIYGENGSGKSSLYYALKDFFQSSIVTIDLAQLGNSFVKPETQGKVAIKVTFKPNGNGQNQAHAYLFDTRQNDTCKADDTSIRDGNKLKSFITYKHLLAIHHIKKDQAINLFDLLVNGVLKHFKYSLTNGKELGELWNEVEQTIARSTGKEYPINKKRSDVNAAIKVFNEAFGELFKPDSPEYILTHAKPILDQFKHNIEIKLNFPQVRQTADYTALEGAKVLVDLRYAGKPIEKPNLFLNEARLSSIALSIYLGMIKRHVQGIPCKILFLDDVFMGTRYCQSLAFVGYSWNRIPRLPGFITTYDKPWFEYARGFLEQKSGWKTMEFYSQICDVVYLKTTNAPHGYYIMKWNKIKFNNGIEIPVIFDYPDLIAKAEKHLKQCDYK